MKIAIAGTGYVGLSNAVLLSQKHEVTAVDVVESKVRLINEKKSPIADRKSKNILLTKIKFGCNRRCKICVQKC